MSIIGKELEIGLAGETTRGTAESAADKWVKHVTANIIPHIERVEDDSVRGRLEGSEGGRIVKSWFEGDVGGVLHADAIGYLLQNVYGASTSTEVVATTVYSHAFSLAQNIQHPTLSLFRKDGSVEQKVYGGGMVSTLEITASTDDFVRFNSTIMARNGADNADTPSYDTEYDFIAKDIEVKVADTEAGLSGATASKLKNISITYNTGNISDYVFGNESPDDIYNSGLTIEGSFTLNYEDTTFEDIFTGNTDKYLQVAIVGDADLGSGNNPSLTFLFNKVQVTDWNRSGGNDELVTQEISFRAYFNQTDSEQSTVTLQNATASY